MEQTKSMLISTLVLLLFANKVFGQTFEIDYTNNQFLKDGQPFRYISGSLHYFRVPPNYWEDRMLKYKAAGLNTIQTYVEWASHEPEPGVYNFEAGLDLIKFITTAQDNGLLVILRVGPYICAERDMGGFPYWILRDSPDVVLRSEDQKFMQPVANWLAVLLPMIRPYLYSNGGPIITVQVENEYGYYYTCSQTYLTQLRDIFTQYLNDEVILFTTDGPSDGALQCGKIPNVYATVDFGGGTDVASAFAAQRRFEPAGGPYVCSEYYTGWLDHWDEPHVSANEDQIANTLREILAFNGSVNMYMFHGGTNFGFTNGANVDNGKYHAQPTSYDYDAPLSEAGDPNDFYTKIRDVIGEFVDLTGVSVPPPTPKYTFGTFEMSLVGNMFDILNYLATSPPVSSTNPVSFEQLSQAFGFVLYQTTVTSQPASPATLQIDKLHDRGYVFVDNVYVGLLDRMTAVTSISINVANNQNLSVLVENTGRVNVGSDINDAKGILSDVLLDGTVLTSWTQYSIPFNDSNVAKSIPSKILHNKLTHTGKGSKFLSTPPALYSSYFTISSDFTVLPDTFLYLPGWSKGVAFINGHNIGRYWPVKGPQISLYVPSYFLEPFPFANRIMLFELESAPCPDSSTCVVQLLDVPQVDGPTA